MNSKNTKHALIKKADIECLPARPAPDVVSLQLLSKHKSASTMFKYITLLEEIIKKEYERDIRNMKALESIKNLLNKVDYESEEIVVTSSEKFKELLSSLKEEPLTTAEKEVAAWIISIKKNMA